MGHCTGPGPGQRQRATPWGTGTEGVELPYLTLPYLTLPILGISRCDTLAGRGDTGFSFISSPKTDHVDVYHNLNGHLSQSPTAIGQPCRRNKHARLGQGIIHYRSLQLSGCVKSGQVPIGRPGSYPLFISNTSLPCLPSHRDPPRPPPYPRAGCTRRPPWSPSAPRSTRRPAGPCGPP